MRDPWHPKTEEEEAAMMERLDPEEREILEAINDPHYVFPPSDSQRVAALQTAARAALAKTARVSLRLTARIWPLSSIRPRPRASHTKPLLAQSCTST